MSRRTDAEIGRIVRRALQGKRLKPRRLYTQDAQGYLESDRDFLANNNDAAAALLDALAPSKRKADRE